LVEVIAMLTRDDQTVPEAMDIFRSSRGSQIRFWGFKDTPLPLDVCSEIAAAMRGAGKSVVFESLKEDEDGCLIAADFAIRNRCSHLIGCAFYPSVARLLAANGVAFLPTFGRRSGIPRMLHGTTQEILDDARRVLEGGATGLCLSMYRYTDGDPETLAADILRTCSAVPTVVTGSINSISRVETIRRLSPWGITVGSALFEQKFGMNFDWSGQLTTIRDTLEVTHGAA